MLIEGIEVKNYRLFRHLTLDNLPRMTVVIGANGSGKSTLFDVFAFLKDALTENVSAAVARRGGFQELVSRGATGPIELAIKFRESGGRLVTYQLTIGAEKGRAVVEREVMHYRRGHNGQPWRLVDFSKGVGTAIASESVYGQKGAKGESADYTLDDPGILAIKGLGQFRKFRVVSEFRRLIENWHISDIRIADARPSAAAGYAEHLSPSGDNVALVAKYLYENHPDRFQKILKAMRRRIPGVTNVEAKSTDDGRLVLRFQDGSFQDPFIARHVSDGTIKMFAYLTLLYDPQPHPLLAVEEPENQFYHEFLYELAEEFRIYAIRGGQVFVSTQSTDFLNGVELDEIFWLEKRKGFSTAVRANHSENIRSLAEGELPGSLWSRNTFEGVGLFWRD